jgi:hypothetical protein
MLTPSDYAILRALHNRGKLASQAFWLAVASTSALTLAEYERARMALVAGGYVSLDVKPRFNGQPGVRKLWSLAAKGERALKRNPEHKTPRD